MIQPREAVVLDDWEPKHLVKPTTSGSAVVTDIAARIGNYADHPEPRAALAGKIALVVASNQPFYPLYLHWLLGTTAWPAWLTLLTTPFFLVVPALAKRWSLAGRALLPLIGTLNTVLSVKLLGTGSGVELFLLPCALLATLLFSPDERLKTAPIPAIPLIAYLFVDDRLGAPVIASTEYARLVALHGMSVAALIALIGLMCSTILAAREV